MTPRIYTKRLSAEAAPVFMVYPLLHRLRGKRGFLVTVWRRRVEVRW